MEIPISINNEQLETVFLARFFNSDNNNDFVEKFINTDIGIFTNINYQKILESLKEFYEKHKEVRIYFNNDELQNTYLEIITNQFSDTLSSDLLYAQLLNYKHARECALHIYKFLEKLNENVNDYNELATNLQSEIEKIIVPSSEYPEYNIKELSNRAVERFEKIKQIRKNYKLGIEPLDRMLNIKSGNTIAIVAPPKTGKTWLEVIVADNLSQNSKVFFLSAEMHPDDIYNRLASRICKTDISKYDYCNNPNQNIINKFNENVNNIIQKNLTIVKARGMSVEQLFIKIQNNINKYDVFILDYIQRIENNNANLTEREKVLNLSRKLTNIAGKHDKLLIIASQAGRQANSAEYTTAHHAKESAAITEDSDVILSLTNKTDYINRLNIDDPYDLWIDVMQRNGYCGLLKMKFNPSTGEYI